jgi:hypothetical protein
MGNFEAQHPMKQRTALVRAVGLGATVILSPIVKGLDTLGMYTPIQRRINRAAPLSNLYRDSFGTYQAQAQDIFVCSYAKSGTNWLLQIAYEITQRGQGAFDHIYDVVAWPDGSPPLPCVPLDDPTPLAQARTHKRVIKTHLALDVVPQHADARYLSVIRDPKEVFVSSYHFVRDIALGPLMPSVETWLKCFLSPDFMFGPWAECVHSYWSQRERENLLVLFFADLKQDPGGEIAKIADFVGVDLSADELAQVSEKSSFAHMRGIDHKFHPGAIMPMAPGKGHVMRRGAGGSTDEMLNAEQQQQIDAYYRQALQRLGSDFPYDDLFAL